MNDNDQYNEAKTFLNILSQGNMDEIFHFQTFDDNKDSKRPNLNRVLVGTLNQHVDELVKLNNGGAGVFVCVNKIENSQKRDAKSVTKIRALFADKDDGNFEGFPIEPSMVVQTKNGQHAYWITNEISRDSFTEIQKTVINRLKTDTSINDLSRVMRLPGFYHRKDPNNIFMVTIASQNYGKYSLSDLTAAFPKVDVKNLLASTIKGNHTEISNFIDKLDGAIQGEAGDSKTFQVACNLVRGFNLSNDEALDYFKKYNSKCSPPWSEEDLSKKIESARKYGSGDFGSLLKTVTTEQWVYRFIKKNNVTTSYNQKVMFNSEFITTSAVIRKAEIQWDNENRKSKSGVIKNIFEDWEDNSKKAILFRTREVIKYDKNLKFDAGQDPLTIFTEALVGKNCEKISQHRAALGHFVWQVKQKLFGNSVSHHMCPVLVGKQGCGKSKAMENLIRPLKHLSMEGNLETFVRESERFAFGTYYIIKLDEFAKGKKPNLESIKNMISAPDVNYRTFYTQKMAYMPHVATFIGASNHSVPDIFNDQTGNRRFYEIPCMDKTNWNDIGGASEDYGVDYIALWKSIDEEGESPITPFLKNIQIDQEQFRSRSFIEDWLESENLIPLPDDSSEFVSTKKLHLDFMNWLRLQNYNSVFTIVKFGKEISKLLDNKKKNDGSYYRVKIKTITPDDFPSISSPIAVHNTTEEDPELEALWEKVNKTQISLGRKKV